MQKQLDHRHLRSSNFYLLTKTLLVIFVYVSYLEDKEGLRNECFHFKTIYEKRKTILPVQTILCYDYVPLRGSAIIQNRFSTSKVSGTFLTERDP